MIHFNFDKQQTYGDNIDPRLEQIVKHHSKFPIAFWSFCDRNQGVDAFAVNQPPITETVGLHDTVIDALQINDERSYLHIYDGAFVNTIGMTAGILHVMHGGYVGTLTVEGDSIVHVSGHIGSLVVKNRAQVYIYKGAYVDNLTTTYNDSLVRIYKDASVYMLNASVISKVMAETKRCINHYANGNSMVVPFSLSGDFDDSPVIKVRIRFPNKEELVRFCKDCTDRRDSTGWLAFGDVHLSLLHHCYVYDSCYSETEGIDTVEFSADAADNDATTVITTIREYLMANYKGLAGNITIWWRGKHELDVIKIAVRHKNDDIKEAIEKATPEQWDRLLKSVFGDDTKAEGAPHRTHDDDYRLDTLDDPREL